MITPSQPPADQKHESSAKPGHFFSNRMAVKRRPFSPYKPWLAINGNCSRTKKIPTRRLFEAVDNLPIFAVIRRSWLPWLLMATKSIFLEFAIVDYWNNPPFTSWYQGNHGMWHQVSRNLQLQMSRSGTRGALGGESGTSSIDNKRGKEEDWKTQEAWNEKVLLLSFQDSWLMFPYFRTLKDKMTLILKSSNDIFLRYGNPDMPFLWTLSWKFAFQEN